jgi:hypothetical protein
MGRAIAVKVISLLVGTRDLGDLDNLSREIVDEEERRAFRRKLAQIIGLYMDLLVSVVRQYPDLDPHPDPGDLDSKPPSKS